MAHSHDETSTGFGDMFTTGSPGNDGAQGGAAGGVETPHGAGGSGVRPSGPARGYGVGFQGGNGGASGNQTGPGSPSLGLVRKSGRKRVIGGARPGGFGRDSVVKNYSVSDTMQFTDVEEMRSDAISRNFAQEILEKLWHKWQLDTSAPEVMRKAEDVICALIAMRTASPDADYNVFVLLGNTTVDLEDLSRVLDSEEVTRRRFARAIADDVRKFIMEPNNVRLREMLVTELGVKSEYAGLAFDGSTHCSGMSTNQVMFTKELERMNLFDEQKVRDKMASNQQLATAGFQVNARRGAYN